MKDSQLSYMSRSSAAKAAAKKWKYFTTYFDKQMQAWYNREVTLPLPEKAEAFAKYDFVHHVEWTLTTEGKLIPCLVVSCRRNEITEEIPAEFDVQPLTRDLWWDVTETTKGNGMRAKSEIESPVKVVWRIAEEMKGQPRAAVIAACVEAGVNKSTAATQYYKWSKQGGE